MSALAELLAALPVDAQVARAPPNLLLHLGGALVAGGAIGMERSYHGRPAGFRTHTLVCVASSLLMLLTAQADAVPIDPTRMAQGIMTGIGFLGAGVIFREGISVRGLTTAASIWITAAIGVLTGIGMYRPAAVATLITLGVLSAFGWIEARIPSHKFALHRIRFERGHVMPEETLRSILARHGLDPAPFAYVLTGDGRWFEYRTTLRTIDERNFARLAASLEALETVREFRISPSGG